MRFQALDIKQAAGGPGLQVQSTHTVLMVPASYSGCCAEQKLFVLIQSSAGEADSNMMAGEQQVCVLGRTQELTCCYHACYTAQQCHVLAHSFIHLAVCLNKGQTCWWVVERQLQQPPVHCTLLVAVPAASAALCCLCGICVVAADTRLRVMILVGHCIFMSDWKMHGKAGPPLLESPSRQEGLN